MMLPSLLALMCFHAARFDSRADKDGSIILLKDQDRKLWNRELLQRGYYYLARASEGMVPNEYSIEAAIMAVHCTAESYDKTDWLSILSLYEALEDIKGTPVVKLNKAIVMGQIEGPVTAIDEILNHVPMKGYYLYHATLGELYLQNKEPGKAKEHLERAIALTESKAEKRLMEKKLATMIIDY
jgi:RNA polymerase sigma-70 factor (ECF subfamily)